jgi:hypothetical protein
VRSIKFNGANLPVTKTPYGSLVGELQGSKYSIASIAASLPALEEWKVNDGLPERNANYDDSRWVIANHTTTPNPSPPKTYPVLYSDEYGMLALRVYPRPLEINTIIGYHTGNLLWRGRFQGANASGVYLQVIGGPSRYKAEAQAPPTTF